MSQTTDDVINPGNLHYEMEEESIQFGLKTSHFISGNVPKSPLLKINEDNYTMTFVINDQHAADSVINNFFVRL